jgi:hypothetical protein
MMVAVDRSWFEERKDYYLHLPEFVRFQEISGVDFGDLLGGDLETVARTQQQLASQSVILHETRKEHAGFGMPFIVYTHDLGFGDQLPWHNEELDRMILAGDLADSLRRRHIALSHALLPAQVLDLSRQFGEQISILNLGSGVGLDMINALFQARDGVEKVINLDVNQVALDCGRRLTASLVSENLLPADVVEYRRQSLMHCQEQGHLAIMVGIICGLEDTAALKVLRRVYSMIHAGGRLVITSSNEKMRSHSPLSSFLIQHIGSSDAPFSSWGLNYHSREGMRELFENVGFHDIQIYDDHYYPGRDSLPDSLAWGVDTLPSRILGRPHDGLPMVLPPVEIRHRREGYNWLAVATKPFC